MISFQETHINLLRWLEKPIEEFERKAKKAHRLKQKIWTQEDEDYAVALANLQEAEIEKLFLVGFPYF